MDEQNNSNITKDMSTSMDNTSMDNTAIDSKSNVSIISNISNISNIEFGYIGGGGASNPDDILSMSQPYELFDAFHSGIIDDDKLQENLDRSLDTENRHLSRQITTSTHFYSVVCVSDRTLTTKKLCEMTFEQINKEKFHILGLDSYSKAYNEFEPVLEFLGVPGTWNDDRKYGFAHAYGKLYVPIEEIPIFCLANGEIYEYKPDKYIFNYDELNN